MAVVDAETCWLLRSASRLLSTCGISGQGHISVTILSGLAEGGNAGWASLGAQYARGVAQTGHQYQP